jgi:hypothetical protein
VAGRRAWASASALFLVVMLAAKLCAVGQTQPDTQSPPEAAFSPKVASQLLAQVREGLEGRSQKKFLSAFSLSSMAGSAVFKQQINGLFSRTDSVRIHMNLVEVSSSAPDHPIVLVDAEMEASPRDNSLPVHKRTRLAFTAEKTLSGWRFVNVQPRSFFSL